MFGSLARRVPYLGVAAQGRFFGVSAIFPAGLIGQAAEEEPGAKFG